MGNEVSNVAVSRKSVSAEATGKPESGMKKSRKKLRLPYSHLGKKLLKISQFSFCFKINLLSFAKQKKYHYFFFNYTTLIYEKNEEKNHDFLFFFNYTFFSGS